jgi:hypothetical protein
MGGNEADEKGTSGQGRGIKGMRPRGVSTGAEGGA